MPPNPNRKINPNSEAILSIVIVPSYCDFHPLLVDCYFALHKAPPTALIGVKFLSAL
jgi:hypothetical protein